VGRTRPDYFRPLAVEVGAAGLTFGTYRRPHANHSMSVTTEPTDLELLDRMAGGDREALAIIFRRHHATVYRFSRQMLGSIEAAEDVTQDVFVALTKGAGRFDPAVASLSTYLYGIARHLVLQRYKRSRSRVEVNIDTVLDQDEAPFAITSDPAEMLTRAQASRELRRTILRLPVHYREVIVLCELNGLSYEDAAAIIRCPVGTVRSRLSRARQILIERCRTLLERGQRAAASACPKTGKLRRASPKRGLVARRREGKGQRWLIPTKNNC
jgi:RNA polymerase sigma-70 factor (ECF subfamily)